MIIAGDVGGTKTRLALYAHDGGTTPQAEKVYPSDKYPHLEDIVQIFMQETGSAVTSAVFGVPGPVVNGEVRVTNLPWVITEHDLQTRTRVPKIKLMNDLEATAYSIPFLPPSDLFVLNDKPVTPGNKVVIAPGTGLGESILFYHEGKYIASATEGGHTDFAPRSLFEIELLRYLMGKFGHVSYERLCSGIGIPHIYDYLKDNHYAPEMPAIAEKLQHAEDRTPIIVQAALNLESDMCLETLNAFVSILGAEAGNMALNTMARGGVYLGGGIPPRIVEKLKDGTFMAAFMDKGRFADMLQQIPVFVIMNDKAAMFGAACYALGM